MTKLVGVSKISQTDQKFVLQSLCVNNVKLSRSLFVLSRSHWRQKNMNLKSSVSVIYMRLCVGSIFIMTQLAFMAFSCDRSSGSTTPHDTTQQSTSCAVVVVYWWTTVTTVTEVGEASFTDVIIDWTLSRSSRDESSLAESRHNILSSRSDHKQVGSTRRATVIPGPW